MSRKVCCRCVMDDTDPNIMFDQQGICNHCTTAIQRLNEKGTEEEKAKRLKNRIEQIKRRNSNKPYDVIMGVSGGVDSSYALIKAKAQGLRILAVHCDTGWNSEIAVSNIHNLLSKLEIDLETYVVDWNVMKSLQRSFFLASVPDCDIPQDHAIVAVNNIVANRLGIKDFIAGGNLVGECISPGSWGYDCRDLKHIESVNQRFDNIKLGNYPRLSQVYSYFYQPYIRGVMSYRLLDDIHYDPIEAKQYLMNEYGWRSYGGKHHESVFTKLFQAYYLPEKFNFDKRKSHLSSLIASGLLTREEAVCELEKPLYKEVELKHDLSFLCKKLGFSESQWQDIMQTSVKQHSDYGNGMRFKDFMLRVKGVMEKQGLSIKKAW